LVEEGSRGQLSDTLQHSRLIGLNTGLTGGWGNGEPLAKELNEYIKYANQRTAEEDFSISAQRKAAIAAGMKAIAERFEGRRLLG
jgi:hypothetical protein